MSGTVKLWQQVVKQLQVLHTAAASGNTGLPFAAQLGMLVYCNRQIAQGPPGSSTTWEALVHKEKVGCCNPSRACACSMTCSSLATIV